MSTQGLKDQFAGIDSSQLVDVVMKGPVGDVYRYKANPITVIKCLDKNGRPAELMNGPSIEMRITHRGKKTIFYFDRVFVGDSTVKGVRSRFLESVTATIPLRDITKIEVQNGRKNFQYVSK